MGLKGGAPLLLVVSLTKMFAPSDVRSVCFAAGWIVGVVRISGSVVVCIFLVRATVVV